MENIVKGIIYKETKNKKFRVTSFYKIKNRFTCEDEAVKYYNELIKVPNYIFVMTCNENDKFLRQFFFIKLTCRKRHYI